MKMEGAAIGRIMGGAAVAVHLAFEVGLGNQRLEETARAFDFPDFVGGSTCEWIRYVDDNTTASFEVRCRCLLSLCQQLYSELISAV